jgi:transmembrane sensor
MNSIRTSCFDGTMTKADLFKKFLENNCSEEEASLVLQYLESEPSLLDQILEKSEWDEIDTSIPIPPTVELEMCKNVASKTMRPIFRIGKSALAAAAMLSGLVLGLIVLYHSTRELPVEDRYATRRETTDNIQKISNNTAANKQIILADNSTVTLFPGSSVEYNIAFKQRAIKLDGKAIFDVTKNAASKFVVYSGAISTTALGTRFLVDNSNDVTKINIKLYEGRVVIQPADTNFLIRETFLEAGQQCFVDIHTMLVKVGPLFASRIIAHKKASPADNKNKSLSSLQESGRLSFSKTPLHEVFENLGLVYHQIIHFNREEMSGRHFTGSFRADDSLSNILKVISVMNQLQVSIKDGAINVVKADPENDRQQRSRMPGDINSPGYKIALIDSINFDSKFIVDSKKLADRIKIIDSTAFIGSIKTQNITPAPDSIAKSETIQPVSETIAIGTKAIKYTRIPLPQLFVELQKQTKRKIHFDKEALNKINFTGAIPFDESVRNTLATICMINDLTLTVKKGAYYITKSEH